MMRLLFGLAALPFMAGIASAGQPLTNAQMDAVTAGFSATSLANASALGPITATAAMTLSSVQQLLQTTVGKTPLTAVRSNTLSSSASTALPLPAATVSPTSP